MPTFCRHNRFLERCPICSKTLPGRAPAAAGGGGARRERSRSGSSTRTHGRSEQLHVRREARAEDDGYRSQLVPGLRASADAQLLAREIAFASGRLLALTADRPGFYAEIRTLAGEDLERATWACFLTAYLSPLQDGEPFAGIRRAIELGPEHGAPISGPRGEDPALPDLAGLPLGPRTSHDPVRGSETLLAYRQWVQRGGSAAAHTPAPDADARQSTAFTGDAGWSPQRRFERLFERLALPGFGRGGRYELLVLLARLGLYELRPDALHLGTPRGQSSEDQTTSAAKRVFAIADTQLLERRARALADASGVPIEALDVALANWAAPERATLGFPPDTSDEDALDRASSALAI
jgi:hypothetical protein